MLRTAYPINGLHSHLGLSNVYSLMDGDMPEEVAFAKGAPPRGKGASHGHFAGIYPVVGD